MLDAGPRASIFSLLRRITPLLIIPLPTTNSLPGAIVKTTPEDEYPFETLVDLEDVHQLMHNALIDDGFSPGKAMSDPDYSKAAKQVFNTLRDTLKKPPMVPSMERKQHIMMN